MTGKTRKLTYFDPELQRTVTREVNVPPPVRVQTLSCGASVEEIEDMASLKSLWNKSACADVQAPLANEGRQAIKDQLLGAFTDPTERAVVSELAASHHFNDDRLLKVLSRLLNEAQQQRRKRERQVNKREELLHKYEVLNQERARLKSENKALHGDVKKLVEERDALRRQKGGSDLIDQIAKLSIEKQDMANALAASKAQCLRFASERDAASRDAKRNLELALTEYETSVMGKLGSVAEDHNKVVAENATLKGEVARLTGEQNVLRSLVKTKEERDMNEANNETEAVVAETLHAGDEVYCKVSGEGPFVLMTQVDEGVVEYANPIGNKKNTFAVGKIQVPFAWLVRCKDGTFRTFPAPALTKMQPKSSLSLVGFKNVVTSDVTAKVVQYAIWVAMLTYLFMRG